MRCSLPCSHCVTLPSSLNAEDLAELRMCGTAPAGQPPAMPAPARAAALAADTVIEVSRVIDVNGNADLAGRKVKVGPELARGKVTPPQVQRIKMGQSLAGQVARVWADEVTVHVTAGGQLVKTGRPLESIPRSHRMTAFFGAHKLHR